MKSVIGQMQQNFNQGTPWWDANDAGIQNFSFDQWANFHEPESLHVRVPENPDSNIVYYNMSPTGSIPQLTDVSSDNADGRTFAQMVDDGLRTVKSLLSNSKAKAPEVGQASSIERSSLEEHFQSILEERAQLEAQQRNIEQQRVRLSDAQESIDRVRQAANIVNGTLPQERFEYGGSASQSSPTQSVDSNRVRGPLQGASQSQIHRMFLCVLKFHFSICLILVLVKKRYGPLVGANVGCGPSGALQILAAER